MPNIMDTINTADGSCTVHLLTPNGHEARVPWPGVIMYPDAGGLCDILQHMTAKLASYIYTACCCRMCITAAASGRRSTWPPCSATRANAGACSA